MKIGNYKGLSGRRKGRSQIKRLAKKTKGSKNLKTSTGVGESWRLKFEKLTTSGGVKRQEKQNIPPTRRAGQSEQWSKIPPREDVRDRGEGHLYTSGELRMFLKTSPKGNKADLNTNPRKQSPTAGRGGGKATPSIA